MDEAKPWDQMPGESTRAYSAFLAFRDLGRQRSVHKAAVSLGKKPSTAKSWARTAKQFNWKFRVDAYDSYMDTVRQKKKEEDILDMEGRHVTEALLLQSKALTRLRDIDVDDIPVYLLPKMIQIAVQIERLARGLPNNITQSELTGSDGKDLFEAFSDIPDDELRELAGLKKTAK